MARRFLFPRDGVVSMRNITPKQAETVNFVAAFREAHKAGFSVDELAFVLRTTRQKINARRWYLNKRGVRLPRLRSRRSCPACGGRR